MIYLYIDVGRGFEWRHDAMTAANAPMEPARSLGIVEPSSALPVGTRALREEPEPNADHPVSSAKWMLPWVWRRLGTRRLRILLYGICMGDGTHTRMLRTGVNTSNISTSSYRHRGELLRLAYHCGYSAYLSTEGIGERGNVPEMVVHISTSEDNIDTVAPRVRLQSERNVLIHNAAEDQHMEVYHVLRPSHHLYPIVFTDLEKGQWVDLLGRAGWPVRRTMLEPGEFVEKLSRGVVVGGQVRGANHQQQPEQEVAAVGEGAAA